VCRSVQTIAQRSAACHTQTGLLTRLDGRVSVSYAFKHPTACRGTCSHSRAWSIKEMADIPNLIVVLIIVA
jgi:hypothetical protein